MKHNIALALATIVAGFTLALSLPGVAMAACQLIVGEGFTVEICTDDDPTTPTPPTATPIPGATSTPVILPTATPISTPPPSGGGSGIWISPGELAQLPTSGAAWSDVQSAANRATCNPDLSNQDDSCNTTVLAKALAYARTGDTKYRDQVVAAIRTVTTGNTESGGRTLALGRELVAYITAADLIDLRNVDPSLHNAFSLKLRELLTKNLDGRTLVSTHVDRPNNWGTMAGASRAGIAAYTGDRAELDRTASVFAWFVGEPGYPDPGAKFGSDISWRCGGPFGINPKGCMKSGHDIGGAIPDDQRRGGSFKMPSPSATGYPWESLQGLIVQAELLHRAGYPAWEWGERGVCRAVDFLRRINWSPSGDDRWQVALIAARCGPIFGGDALGSGKNMGWTAWTHGGELAARSADPPVAQSATAYVDIAADRIIIGDTEAEVAEEVAYLVGLEGWIAVGEIQVTTDADGAEVYSQAVVR